MQMKKRVLSVLLALCLAGSLASTAWAAGDQATPETAEADTSAVVLNEEEEQQDETTASQEETSREEQEPADQEEELQADAASYPAQEFETTVESSDVTVNVSAPEGALPENVTLTASLVGSSEDDADDQALADVARELDKAEVEYDGFVALDISFVDADGNKVEPLQPVSVNFTLPAELLPEDVDASTLEVQHLKENEAGEVEEVETVADTADATEGTVTVEGAVVQAADSQPLANDVAVNAEFAVSGFSTFTLTWTENKLFGQSDTESISFNIVDTDGTPLDLDGSSYNLTYTMPVDGIVTFEQMVEANGIKTIEVNGVEYVFRNATLVIGGTERHPVSAAERIASDWGDAGNDKIRFYDSVFPGSTGYYTRDDELDGNKDDVLELVYRRQDESSSTVYEPEPTYTKQAVITDGGATYDLSLSVSGDVGESTEDVKLDVLFIVDQSGSMIENVNYQKIVADCAGDLATALAGNDNLDTRFAVVTFSSGLSGTDYYKDAIQRLSWTTNASSVYSAANPRSTGDDDKNENDVITKNLDVTFTSVTYTKPGIYRYKVTETDPEGFTFTDTSDNTFYMDVYVERTTSGFQVSGVVFMKNNGTMPEFVAGEDEAPDVADYGEGKMSGDVDTYTTYTLEINKKVAGALADAGDTYNFDVTFTGLPEDTYLTIGDSKYATAADESGELNVTNSISIVPGPNGNSVIIYGIPSSASYDVIENLLSSEGYTVTAKINDTPVTVEANGQGTAYHTGTVALKGENDSKIDDVVEITNTREAVTPTGIVMNVAPYALLVVIAAAGCFVFLRKRRED